MRRWRRTIAACRWAGLVATIALAAAWIVSGWWSASVARDRSWVTVTVGFGRGAIECANFDHARPWSDTGWRGQFDRREVIGAPRWTWWFRSEWLGRGWFVQVPFWAPFVAVAGPTFWLARRERLRRGESGRCPVCGYSLEGLPPGAGEAVCPECGVQGAAKA